MHDGVVRVDRGDLGHSRRLMLSLVMVMGRWPVVVSLIDMIGRGVHMQLGRLHVDQRESRHESQRQ